ERESWILVPIGGNSPGDLCYRRATRRGLRSSQRYAPVQGTMTSPESPLTTDLYELNMVQAYLDRGEDKEAVFEFFVRRLPERRACRRPAGLDEALTDLEALRCSPGEIDWLKSTKRFRGNLIDYLAAFRFTGDVHAIPAVTVCFPHAPQ